MEETKMTAQDTGFVKISEDVIAVLSSNATLEIAGVSAMSGTAASGIAEKLGMKNTGKGVKVETKENECIIDIHVVVEYGARIPDVAWRVQESVKKSVEEVTGMNVLKVNIFIDGINIPKTQKPELKIELDDCVESAE